MTIRRSAPATLLLLLMLITSACQPVQPPSTGPVLTPTPVDAPTSYTDAAGLFTIPIPTKWTLAEHDDYTQLTSPEGAIEVYVLALPMAELGTDDLVEAITAAWRVVDPAFDLETEQVLEEPSRWVERSVSISYATGDNNHLVLGTGKLYQDVAYITLFQGDLVSIQRRLAQVQIIGTGFEILALEGVNLRDAAARPVDEQVVAQLEAYIRATMERFGIPGAAVAIVQGDEMVYAQGFGVRDPTGGTPMTPATQMMIGSTTKTMTTLFMATLVDDGLMYWDTPVQRILPDFAVADPTLSSRITMRNMVCACTGVPRRDYELLFNADDLTAEAIIESLATFEFFTDFGEAFQYSNQMVAAGGYLATLAAGGEYGSLYQDYAAAMRARVLDPIGMADTTLSLEKVTARDNYAIPHWLNLDCCYSPAPLDVDTFVDPVAPAGAYWSTVQDLAKYIITELNHGVAPDGTPVVSERNLVATWIPQIDISADAAYGLGWVVGSYHGQPLLSHGGNTLGYTSDLAFLPEADVGIAILTNGRATNFFNEGVRYRLFELLFDQQPEVEELVNFSYNQMETAFAQLTATVTETVDLQRVESHLGAYTNDALGEITLAATKEGELLLDAGEFTTHLCPRLDEQGETLDYMLMDLPLSGAIVDLTTDETGAPLIVLGQGVVEYRFTPDGGPMPE